MAAGDLRHTLASSSDNVLTRSEWEASVTHELESGVIGDVLIFNGTKIVGIAAGATGTVLQGNGAGVAPSFGVFAGPMAATKNGLGAPPYSFVGDGDTGIDSYGADQVDVVTNGAQVATFGSTGALTLRNSAPGTILSLQTTDAGAVGLYITTLMNSSTPAAADEIFRLYSQGNNSALATVDYGMYGVMLDDPTAASEDSYIHIRTRQAGTLADRLIIGRASTGVDLQVTLGISIGATAASPDLFLYRDVANALAQRNAANAQIFRVYNTFTTSTNYERGGIRWNSNVFEVFTEADGAGASRSMQLTVPTGTNIALDVAGTDIAVISSTGISIAGNLTFSGASRNIIQGTTNFSIRNNANSADNLLITDAGAVTFRSTVSGITTLLFPSAGIINFGAGDVLITHSANLLSFTGSANGYAFDSTVYPTAVSDFGATTTRWRDGFFSRDIYAGTPGSSLGTVRISGNTSGTITITTAAVAGTWTFTLPPDDGDVGEQLQTNGAGVTTWEAAASRSKYKNFHRVVTPEEGLRRILNLPAIWEWSYKSEMEDGSRRKGTGDFKTHYTGVTAEDAPWAMHHNGDIFSPVSAFGNAALGIMALNNRMDCLEDRVAKLELIASK